jgi:hypothetical protein
MWWSEYLQSARLFNIGRSDIRDDRRWNYPRLAVTCRCWMGITWTARGAATPGVTCVLRILTNRCAWTAGISIDKFGRWQDSLSLSISRKQSCCVTFIALIKQKKIVIRNGSQVDALVDLREITRAGGYAAPGDNTRTCLTPGRTYYTDWLETAKWKKRR